MSEDPHIAIVNDPLDSQNFISHLQAVHILELEHDCSNHLFDASPAMVCKSLESQHKSHWYIFEQLQGISVYGLAPEQQPTLVEQLDAIDRTLFHIDKTTSQAAIESALPESQPLSSTATSSMGNTTLLGSTLPASPPSTIHAPSAMIWLKFLGLASVIVLVWVYGLHYLRLHNPSKTSTITSRLPPLAGVDEEQKDERVLEPAVVADSHASKEQGHSVAPKLTKNQKKRQRKRSRRALGG